VKALTTGHVCAAGKGIGYARLALPWDAAAHVFNTHTHANWVHSVRIDAQLPDVQASALGPGC
jgi:hypothetical protein